MRRMAARQPAFLGFAHFGADPLAQKALNQAETRLWDWVHWVEQAGAEGDLAEAMRRWVLDGYRQQGFAAEVIDQYDRNTFWPMQVTGIQRWLEKRGGVGT